MGISDLRPAVASRLRTTVQIEEVPLGRSTDTTSPTASLPPSSTSIPDDERFLTGHRKDAVVGPLMPTDETAGYLSARVVNSRDEGDGEADIRARIRGVGSWALNRPRPR